MPVMIDARKFRGRRRNGERRGRHPFTVAGALEDVLYHLPVDGEVVIEGVLDRVGAPVPAGIIRMHVHNIGEEAGRYYTATAADTDFLRVIRLS